MRKVTTRLPLTFWSPILVGYFLIILQSRSAVAFSPALVLAPTSFSPRISSCHHSLHSSPRRRFALDSSGYSAVTKKWEESTTCHKTGHPRRIVPFGGNENDTDSSRRSILSASIIFATSFSSASLPRPSLATVISLETPSVGTLQSLTPSEAERRLRAGRESVAYLLDHYDEICEGGGDNVRRYLGTVGTTSGLFGIGKAMKTLADGAEDVVDYTELATEIEKTIQQADGSAYMAIFTSTSTSGVPPSKYFADAKIEIERCAKGLDELAALIGLKF